MITRSVLQSILLEGDFDWDAIERGIIQVHDLSELLPLIPENRFMSVWWNVKTRECWAHTIAIRVHHTQMAPFVDNTIKDKLTVDYDIATINKMFGNGWVRVSLGYNNDRITDDAVSLCIHHSDMGYIKRTGRVFGPLFRVINDLVLETSMTGYTVIDDQDDISAFISSGKLPRRMPALTESDDGQYDGRSGWVSIEKFPITREGKFWMNATTGVIYMWHDSRIEHSGIASDLDNRVDSTTSPWDDAVLDAMFGFKWVRGLMWQNDDGTTIGLHGDSLPIRKSMKVFEDQFSKMIDVYTLDLRITGNVKGVRFYKNESVDAIPLFIKRGIIPRPDMMREDIS